MDRKKWIELQVANFNTDEHIKQWNTMLLKKECIASITKWGDRCYIKLDYMNDGYVLVDMLYENLLIELFS